MEENLELWRKVEKTNPNYTKKAKIGGHTITAIAPQYQIMQVTEQFGVYGRTWGFKDIKLSYDLVDKCNLVVFRGTFFFPNGEFEIINSSKLYIDRNNTMIDDNFAKKIETDSLTKAISKLGFNADIFLGKFDDVRYLAEVTEEFKPKPVTKPALNQKQLDGLSKVTDVEVLRGYFKTHEITEEQKGLITKLALKLKG